LDDLIARVNEDLEIVVRWPTENGLLLSLRKSHVIFVSISPPTVPPSILFLEWKDVVTAVIGLVDMLRRFVLRFMLYCIGYAKYLYQ
jgi:hypothetical protein